MFRFSADPRRSKAEFIFRSPPPGRPLYRLVNPNRSKKRELFPWFQHSQLSSYSSISVFFFFWLQDIRPILGRSYFFNATFWRGVIPEGSYLFNVIFSLLSKLNSDKTGAKLKFLDQWTMHVVHMMSSRWVIRGRELFFYVGVERGELIERGS